jgi:hypothetical protein
MIIIISNPAGISSGYRRGDREGEGGLGLRVSYPAEGMYQKNDNNNI